MFQVALIGVEGASDDEPGGATGIHVMPSSLLARSYHTMIHVVGIHA